MQLLAARGTRRENAVGAVSVDLVFVHVLKILYYLVPRIHTVFAQFLRFVLLGHSDVLLLQSVAAFPRRTVTLLGTLTVAIVVVDSVRRNDLDLNLVRLAKSLREEAAAPLLLDGSIFIPLQCLIGVAAWRTQLCMEFLNKHHVSSILIF